MKCALSKLVRIPMRGTWEKEVPDGIGVYIFAHNTTPLYIGKSVCIRSRIKSHISASHISKKEKLFITKSNNLYVQTLLSDFESLLYEASAIQQFKPRYNIALKESSNQHYIKITIAEKYPKILITRESHDNNNLYYGPFSSINLTKKLLRSIRAIVPFCTSNKIGIYPCFYTRINLCDPCPNMIHKMKNICEQKQVHKIYIKNIQTIIEMLSGKTDSVLLDLKMQMKEATANENYEKAILFRNRIFHFHRLLTTEFSNINTAFDPTRASRITTDFVLFMNSIFSMSIDPNNYRIEGYDISTLFGTNTTGSMVVFESGSFILDQYRRFRIKTKIERSDIHHLIEVIKRRLAHAEWRYPDLMLIDGGTPQLSAVNSVIKMNNLSIPILAIAKRPDRLIINGINRNASYSKYTLLLFQSIRDESHRFAKKYHLLLRSRNILI